jgi:membrane protein DedA with SNARE-associated domain
VSAQEARRNPTEIVAGYLATFSIVISGLAIVYRPVRLAPIAAVVALTAAGMASGRSKRITQIAVGAAVVGWLAGMIAAVVTDNPLW